MPGTYTVAFDNQGSFTPWDDRQRGSELPANIGATIGELVVPSSSTTVPLHIDIPWVEVAIALSRDGGQFGYNDAAQEIGMVTLVDTMTGGQTVVGYGGYFVSDAPIVRRTHLIPGHYEARYHYQRPFDEPGLGRALPLGEDNEIGCGILERE